MSRLFVRHTMYDRKPACATRISSSQHLQTDRLQRSSKDKHNIPIIEGKIAPPRIIDHVSRAKRRRCQDAKAINNTAYHFLRGRQHLFQITQHNMPMICTQRHLQDRFQKRCLIQNECKRCSKISHRPTNHRLEASLTFHLIYSFTFICLAIGAPRER